MIDGGSATEWYGLDAYRYGRKEAPDPVHTGKDLVDVECIFATSGKSGHLGSATIITE